MLNLAHSFLLPWRKSL
ncbi:hypothetical protein OIU74_018479 [Salix koriyanagi]|uniref:Uncharacterized protein n=1 Tax=Salix koriyanagi TaxID=2511006 RepID=A0A9Q1AID1_9ROSI|nr:hypothetical protein OIU74_018479 [Salix koriyanagi]